MGRVYLARDPVLNRDVALKVLRDDLGIPPEVEEALLTRMRHEAQAAARVSHPNIVTLHDMGEDDGVGLYLVFECVNGPNLKERLKSGRLPPMQAARLARELGSALSCAHLAGVLHRDVKPENVMLAPTGAKIADFGIAKIPDSTLTRAGTLVGTPAYCAPEALASGEFSPESDQFSLAATLYEAVSGERAFPGEDAVGVASKIATAEVRPIARKCSLPDEVDDVLLRGLEKHPARRFASAAELGEALASALDRTARTALASGPVIEIARISRPIDTGSVLALPPAAIPIVADARRERQQSTIVLGAITIALASAMVGYAAHGGTPLFAPPPLPSVLPSTTGATSASTKAGPLTPSVTTVRHRPPTMPSASGSAGGIPSGTPTTVGSGAPSGTASVAPPAVIPPSISTAPPSGLPPPAKSAQRGGLPRQRRRSSSSPAPRTERERHDAAGASERERPACERRRPDTTALERDRNFARRGLTSVLTMERRLEERKARLHPAVDRDHTGDLSLAGHPDVEIARARKPARVGRAEHVLPADLRHYVFAETEGDFACS
jgi:serine/threonine-protein kinase